MISEPNYINVPEQLKNSLKEVLKNTPIPELNSNAWSLGILKEVSIEQRVRVDLVLPSFGLKSEKNIAFSVKKALLSYIEDPSIIDINFYAEVRPTAKQSIDIKDIADVRNVILIASGKGGVGKSTIASNLAVSMANLGCRVGLLDADVYGPSIPIMFDLKKDGLVKGFVEENSKTTYMVPPIKYNVSLMSIGFLVDTDAPMIWRGPMIAQASMQMFYNVYWGQLDYLIVDLPPGTGDIQLTLAQKVNVAGAVIVSTPQSVALEDVVRAKKMFDKVNIPTLGIVENMSYFICDTCDKHHHIFSSGGAKSQGERLGLGLLGQIPLVTDLRKSGDIGEPISAQRGENTLKENFTDMAHRLIAQIVNMSLTQGMMDNIVHNQIKPQNESIKPRRLNVI